MSAKKTTAGLGASGLRWTAAYLFAMVIIYFGERVVESTTARMLCWVIGAAGILAALAARFQRIRASRSTESAGRKATPVERRILLCYIGGLVGLALYLMQADFMMDKLRPMFETAQASDRYEGVFATLWPIVWLCSMLPLIFIEISYAAMDMSRTVELRRINLSAASAMVLAMSVVIVGSLNFIGEQLNEKIDLSYFKTTRPSDSSKKMVQNLSKPLKVYLFYPGANEVQEHVQSYFTELAAASSQLEVQVVDHALDPKLAKQLAVTKNGTVVLSSESRNERVNIGTKLNEAKRALKKLDSEFQAAFLKVSRGAKIAYITVGHEELDRSRRDGIEGASIRDMRTVLQRLNYTIKQLGIGQGLSEKVPDDATLLIIAGPRKRFVESEVRSIHGYLARGGRMLILLDPEAKESHKELLDPLGLNFHPIQLANDRHHIRAKFNQSDRRILYSIRFKSHPSVTTLDRNAPRVAAIFMGAGYLTKDETGTAALNPKVKFTIQSMSQTYDDANENFTYDSGAEHQKTYQLAAAATFAPTSKPAPSKDAKDKKAKPTKAEDEEGRAVVVADADLFSDRIFRNPGNQLFFLDSVKWLGGDEKFQGEVSSEEDVRISHTRKEDQVWFYLTTIAVPAFVVGFGIFRTRRRRRK